MIFSQPLYGKVLRGEKTETRRLVAAGDLETKYRVGMRKAVQRGRGIHGEAYILLTAVRRETLDELECPECGGNCVYTSGTGWQRDCGVCEGRGYVPRLTIHDAKTEGFRTTDEFKLYWLGLHDKAWFERKAIDGEPPEHERIARFNIRWAHKEVWVLTFTLDHTEQPLMLMQGSPLTDGGKARVMSNRKVTPNRAKPREVTGPEEHGYTASTPRAMPLEPEPIDVKLNARYAREGHQGFVARERARELDRELLLAEERLRLVGIEAKARGVDIAHLEAQIMGRIRAAERKVHNRKAA